MKKKVTRDDLSRKAHDLTLELYRMVHCDDRSPEFQLSVEIRKAAQDLSRSLMSELDSDLALDGASGASLRLQALLQLAKDLAFFPNAGLADFQTRAGEIGAAVRKMMSGLKASGS